MGSTSRPGTVRRRRAGARCRAPRRHRLPRAVHQLLHGRPEPGRFHVRGYTDQGTTTPFAMVVLTG
ncbi:hypothetical protein ABT262_23520 [Amycolatopsis mediterranei]